MHRFQVIIPAITNVPADACVNTWHFNLTGGTDPVATVLGDLQDFYETWATYRGAGYDWDGIHVKGYNLEDTPPRVPVFDDPLGSTGLVGTTCLPHEVALVVSFRAAQQSGLNPARRRNRVYLGPFAEVANNTGGRPESGMLTPLVAGAQALLNASNTSSDYSWAINSTFVPPTTIVNVHDGWIDDSWDTQRRRGIEPTSRLAFSTIP